MTTMSAAAVERGGVARLLIAPVAAVCVMLDNVQAQLRRERGRAVAARVIGQDDIVDDVQRISAQVRLSVFAAL